MFPTIRVSFSGVDPDAKYIVLMDIVPVTIRDIDMPIIDPRGLWRERQIHLYLLGKKLLYYLYMRCFAIVT